jgi:hypothetical protein
MISIFNALSIFSFELLVDGLMNIVNALPMMHSMMEKAFSEAKKGSKTIFKFHRRRSDNIYNNSAIVFEDLWRRFADLQHVKFNCQYGLELFHIK